MRSKYKIAPPRIRLERDVASLDPQGDVSSLLQRKEARD